MGFNLGVAKCVRMIINGISRCLNAIFFISPC